MIPKVIHYCRLSGEAYPQKIEYCIATWHKIIPDYTFVLWDWQKCLDENIVIPWVKEAFDKKKYAFAADFIRMYALYKYGGIYLDSDVEVVKPFDDLLFLPYFIGREGVGNRVEVAAFGAEKGCEWIKLCMDYYEDRNFIKLDGTLDTKVIPDIVYEIITSHYHINNIENTISFIQSEKVFNQFPNDWFCANVHIRSDDMKPTYIVSENTYCVHHFVNSWLKVNKFRLFGKHLLLKFRNFFKRKIKDYIN